MFLRFIKDVEAEVKMLQGEGYVKSGNNPNLTGIPVILKHQPELHTSEVQTDMILGYPHAWRIDDGPGRSGMAPT